MNIHCSLLAALLATGPCAAQLLPAHILVVRADAAPGGDGRTWATAYHDLQLALDNAAASSGAITDIWIAQGVYAAPDASWCQDAGYKASNVSLYGGFAGVESALHQRPPGARSTLSGHTLEPFTAFCGTVLSITSTTPIVIDRLEVHGEGRGSAIRMNAGGRISDTIARAQTGKILGGTAFSKSGPAPILIERCDFWSSFQNSGHITVTGEATVIDSSFYGFTNAMGDGVIFDRLIARNSSFTGFGDTGPGFRANWIDAQDCLISGSGGYGPLTIVLNGGIVRRSTLNAYGQRQMHLQDVELRDSAIFAYGEFSSSPNIWVDNASFINCRITGACIWYEFITGPSARFANCLFTGVENLGPNTVMLAMTSAWRIDNSIVWANSSPNEAHLIRMPAGITGLINHSCIQGWTGALGGIGNHGLDPQLNPDGSLQPGSPAIDAGDNTAIPPATPYDAIGNCRIADGNGDAIFIVDMGPREYTPCWPNADCSQSSPLLTIADFTAFLQRFAAADPWANCDQSTAPPILNIADFSCFLQRFAAGCN